MMFLTGCAQRPDPALQRLVEPQPVPGDEDRSRGPGLAAMPPDGLAVEIAADPEGFLRRQRARCAALAQYTLTLIRAERRGWLGRMHPPERIAAWFRREPFSVKFVWLDPDIKYGESTYVAGQAGDKVRFTPRRPVLGLKPGVVRVDVGVPVFWGEARHPVTDFGLENLLARTLEKIAAAERGAEIDYRGLSRIGDPPRSVHAVRVHVPQADGAPPTQVLYFDPVSRLPLGTRIINADGSLEAVYLYLDLDSEVALSDADFLLTAEREAAKQGG